jgi:hypothetical protein
MGAVGALGGIEQRYAEERAFKEKESLEELRARRAMETEQFRKGYMTEIESSRQTGAMDRAELTAETQLEVARINASNRAASSDGGGAAVSEQDKTRTETSLINYFANKYPSVQLRGHDATNLQEYITTLKKYESDPSIGSEVRDILSQLIPIKNQLDQIQQVGQLDTFRSFYPEVYKTANDDPLGGMAFEEWFTTGDAPQPE